MVALLTVIFSVMCDSHVRPLKTVRWPTRSQIWRFAFLEEPLQTIFNYILKPPFKPNFIVRTNVFTGPVFWRDVLHVRNRGDVLRRPGPGGPDRPNDLRLPKVRKDAKKMFFFVVETQIPPPLDPSGWFVRLILPFGKKNLTLSEYKYFNIFLLLVVLNLVLKTSQMINEELCLLLSFYHYHGTKRKFGGQKDLTDGERWLDRPLFTFINDLKMKNETKIWNNNFLILWPFLKKSIITEEDKIVGPCLLFFNHVEKNFG